MRGIMDEYPPNRARVQIKRINFVAIISGMPPSVDYEMIPLRVEQSAAPVVYDRLTPFSCLNIAIGRAERADLCVGNVVPAEGGRQRRRLRRFEAYQNSGYPKQQPSKTAAIQNGGSPFRIADFLDSRLSG
jgi:hypothetical protein